ncbi:hypothetical protein LPJ61_002348 [Coemansia biformis]|uniref:Tyrosinase copper-binding domain-containing protein n=1 Tax=Coemansia biformis TaxID=1286918 RepID=A0A9W8CZ94_9FUNG|nr:hypothetical protein LPJ61_002348 [Coemansia biformis]
MRFLAAVLLLALPAALAQNPPKCGAMHERRSAHSLSPAEWQRLGRVVYQLHRQGQFDRFARAHNVVFDEVHGTAAFFPFHRRFVQEFEDLGRRIDPGFTIPYWDTPRDYRDPASSPVLQRDKLGRDGRVSDSCVLDGVQGGWGSLFPGRHCLQRNFNDGDSILPWVPPEMISSYLQSDRALGLFREHIEYGIHGAVHLGLGGDAATPFAPNDLFFFMHHANIDRLWWQWQIGHRSIFDYNGPGPDGDATLDDVIPESRDVNFGGERVWSTMVLGFGSMCYTYDTAPPAPNAYPGARSRATQNNWDMPAFVLSGASNTTEASLEVARIHAAFDTAPGLKDLFPGVAALEPALSRDGAQLGDRGVQLGDRGARCNSNNKDMLEARKLVYPAPLTSAWIEMHGFDSARVKQLYDEGCRLIDMLNNSTYESPY